MVVEVCGAGSVFKFVTVFWKPLWLLLMLLLLTLLLILLLVFVLAVLAETPVPVDAGLASPSLGSGVTMGALAS